MEGFSFLIVFFDWNKTQAQNIHENLNNKVTRQKPTAQTFRLHFQEP